MTQHCRYYSYLRFSRYKTTMVDAAVSLLKISNTPVLQQFLHDCVDDLVGLKQANFDNYNSDIEWTIDDFNKAKNSFQNICRQSVFDNNFEIEFDENLQKEIRNCIDIRRDDVFQALVKSKLVNHGHTVVDNFDWKLKWICGSSKLASVREAILQIDLHCLKNETNGETVNFEVNLNTLDMLIDQLKNANDDFKSTINK